MPNTLWKAIVMATTWSLTCCLLIFLYKTILVYVCFSLLCADHLWPSDNPPKFYVSLPIADILLCQSRAIFFCLLLISIYYSLSLSHISNNSVGFTSLGHKTSRFTSFRVRRFKKAKRTSSGKQLEVQTCLGTLNLFFIIVVPWHFVCTFNCCKGEWWKPVIYTFQCGSDFAYYSICLKLILWVLRLEFNVLCLLKNDERLYEKTNSSMAGG